MVCLALVGNVLKGSQGAGSAVQHDGKVGAPAAVPAPQAAKVASPQPPAIVAPLPASTAEASPPPDAIDDSLPTGSIDPGTGLHRPNPAAYGDAARTGSSLILTGAEAINYLAGNTLRRQAAGEPPRFTYFASRGVVADGSERGFLARRWDRERAELCEPGPGGAPVCGPIQILLDAKQELQGGRLGTVTIGQATAELVKGNVLHVPAYIPFVDGAVAVDAAATPQAPAAGGWSAFVDHTAAITTEAGAERRFVYYGADNRLLEVQPVEDGAGGRAVRVSVGHWRLSKATVCETGATGAAQVCFKPQPEAGGAVSLVPASKGGQALRAVILPETRNRDVAED